MINGIRDCVNTT